MSEKVLNFVLVLVAVLFGVVIALAIQTYVQKSLSTKSPLVSTALPSFEDESSIVASSVTLPKSQNANLQAADCDGTNGSACLAVLAIGQGNCIVASCPAAGTSEKLLSDCGTLNSRKKARITVNDYFRAIGITPDDATQDFNINAIVISHADQDHYNLIPLPFKPDDKAPVVLPFGRIPMGMTVMYGGQRSSYTVNDMANWFTQVGKKVNLISPAKHTHEVAPNSYLPCRSDSNSNQGFYILEANAVDNIDDFNNNSIVLKWNIFDRSLMLPGDAGTPVETPLIKFYAEQSRMDLVLSDVLVAAHHGAHRNTNSLPWIKYTNPEYLLFSARKYAKFGHPRCLTYADFADYEGGAARRFLSVPTHDITCGYSDTQGSIQYQVLPVDKAGYSTQISLNPSMSQSYVIKIDPDSTITLWGCPYRDAANQQGFAFDTCTRIH